MDRTKRMETTLELAEMYATDARKDLVRDMEYLRDRLTRELEIMAENPDYLPSASGVVQNTGVAIDRGCDVTHLRFEFLRDLRRLEV